MSPHSPRLSRRLAGRSVASLLSLVPRRLRFRVAIRIARAIARLLVAAGRFPAGRLIAETPAEQTLFAFLDILTRYGCAFDAEVAFDGRELLDQAIDARKGVLLAAPHAMLTLLVFRYLHDRGSAPLVLAGTPAFRVLGNNAPVTAIRARDSLMRVRTALRGGETVAAMIDRRELAPGQLQYDTPLGRFSVADTLLHLAANIGAQVVFVAYRLDGNSVRARFAVPPQNANAAEMAAAFAAFAREHVVACYAARGEEAKRRELLPDRT